MFVRAPVLAGYSSIMVMSVFMVFLSLQGSGGESVLPAPEPSEAEVATFSVGELLARMPDRPWHEVDGEWRLRSVPAEIQRRMASGALKTSEWHELVLDGGIIHVRQKWPAGEPLAAWVHEPAWLRLTEITVRAIRPDIGTIRAMNMHPSRCGNCDASHAYRERHSLFGSLPLGTTSLELEVTIDQLDGADSLFASEESSHTLWHGRVQFPLMAVPSIEEAMPAVSSDALTQAVKRSVRASWWTRNDLQPRTMLGVGVGGSHEKFPELRGIALAMSVELHRKGTCVSKADLVADGTTNWTDYTKGLVGSCSFDPTPEDLLAPAADLSGWDLVLVGKGDGALRVWEADRWWNGRLSIPLEDIMPPNDAK